MPGHELIGSEELSEIQDIFNRGGVLFRQGLTLSVKTALKWQILNVF